MYLYPYKLFALSKNKRLFNEEDPRRMVGIYDVNKYKYIDAIQKAKENDAKVSILLGEVCLGTKLICLDLDDCFDDEGNMDPETKDFLEPFDDNEWEISSSGTGIHIYVLTKKDFETFIVKEMQGCKSFECYTNKRHIVTTTFDFENTDLEVGKHDFYIEELYKEAQKIREASYKNSQVQMVKTVFGGKEIKTKEEERGIFLGRTPVTDMFTLRGCGYKDENLISIIDENPDAVDQSAHDAKLIRKLMYYCLSFDAAWEMAMKTNYYKAKDERHKKKFNNPTYKERTRAFISRGGGL